MKANKRIDRLARLIAKTPKHCTITLIGVNLKIHQENVIEKQNISDEELKREIVKCDILLCTSDDEGFCYPVYDALKNGKTVIAFELPIFLELYNSIDNLILCKTEKQFLDKLLLCTSS